MGLLSFVFTLSALILSARAATNYIYVSPDAICSVSGNETLNYTCDGSYDFPYTTIKDGLDQADDETIVTLMDGTYTGSRNKNLKIYDKYRRVASENGYANAIIDCEDDGFGIAFNKGTFYLTGVTIQNCQGILRELHNLSLGNGTAVPSVENRTIGGGLWIENAAAFITDCVLDSNTAELGGGLYTYSSSVLINGTTFSNNEAVLGGGIFLWNGYVGLNYSSAVIDNEATEGGGGIYIRKATVELDFGSYLYGNEADNSEGNEVLCISGAGVLLHSSYVSSLSIATSDFEEGDAVCYSDCTLVDSSTNFDYCGYVPPSSDSSSNGNSSDSSDSSTSGGTEVSKGNAMFNISGWSLLFSMGFGMISLLLK